MSVNIGEKVRYMLIFYLSFTIKNLYINSFCKLFQKVQRISQIQKKKNRGLYVCNFGIC